MFYTRQVSKAATILRKCHKKTREEALKESELRKKWKEEKRRKQGQIRQQQFCNRKKAEKEGVSNKNAIVSEQAPNSAAVMSAQLADRPAAVSCAKTLEWHLH